MAAFHFKMQVISRSAGRSVCAAAAYRAAKKIYDQRIGETYDYTRKRGILHNAILAPARAPEWARESESLWNQVEACERRKDAQLARENVIALPHELTLEQNREWLHAFVEEAYVKRGMVVQVNIHAPHRNSDSRNVHAHLLCSLRQCTRDGFKDKKTRTWNEKATLEEWRAQCAAHINQALEKAGRKERVDHRSFADQDLDRMPTNHLGPDAMQMERRGKKTRIGDQNRAAAEYNREREAMEQELRMIDAAIAQEQERIKQEKADAQVEQEIRKKSSFAQQLDPVLKRERAAQEQRLRRQAETEEHYGIEQQEKALRQAEEELKRNQGIFARLSGRKATQEANVEALRRNLENARSRHAEAMGKIEADLEQQYGRTQKPVPSPAPHRTASATPDKTSPAPSPGQGRPPETKIEPPSAASPAPSLSPAYNLESTNDNQRQETAEEKRERRMKEIRERTAKRQSQDRGRDLDRER